MEEEGRASVRLPAPSDVFATFVSLGGDTWGFELEGMGYVPSELAFRNEGQGVGELMHVLLRNCGQLAVARDAQGGVLLHRFAKWCVGEQSRLDALDEKEKEGCGDRMLCVLEAVLEHAPLSAACVDAAGATPLHYMAEVSCSWLWGCVHVLLRHRPSSAWQKNRQQDTPLHLAVRFENNNLARTLVQRKDTVICKLFFDGKGNYATDLAMGKQMRRILLNTLHSQAEPVAMAVQSCLLMLLLLLVVVGYAEGG